MSGLTGASAQASWGRPVVREVLTPESLAGRLEHRLHLPDVGEASVRHGCEYAIEVGMPVVLCRPEHVEVAVKATAGSRVEVATAVDFHLAQQGVSLPAQSYGDRARTLVSRGARQVGLIAGADDVTASGLDGFIARVVSVRDEAAPMGGKVRVLIRTAGMTKAELRTTCRELASAGVSLVQGGTFLGDRVSLQEIVDMREALGPDVLLKWTHPLRSIEAILVCIAEGVDRFNGDPQALLKAAHIGCRYGPIEVPILGVDY